jgi:hypothetical protein
VAGEIGQKQDGTQERRPAQRGRNAGQAKQVIRDLEH